MKTLFDYYVMLNYIVYKFYLRHEEGELNAKLTSIMLASLCLWLPFASIDCIICIFFPEFQLVARQENRLVYAIPLLIVTAINYLLLYRRGRYKEEFMELDKISDTERFARRKRNTKIFITALIVVALVSLIVVSIINKSRF